jgi:hypothetical protein
MLNAVMMLDLEQRDRSDSWLQLLLVGRQLRQRVLRSVTW